MRVWFNRTFSSISSALTLIRDADRHERRYHLIYTSTTGASPAAQMAHQFELEPTQLKGEPYLAWCLDFCRLHQVDIFVPGKEAGLISSAHAAFLEIGTRVLSV